MNVYFFFAFAFYAEIQYWYLHSEKMAAKQENNFCENLPIDSTDTLRIKNFVKIALAHSVSKVKMFVCFTQKFKMATKIGGKTIFAKPASRFYIYPVGQKISSKCLYLAPFLS